MTSRLVGWEPLSGSVALKGMPPLCGWSLPAREVGLPWIVELALWMSAIDYLDFIYAFLDIWYDGFVTSTGASSSRAKGGQVAGRVA